MYVFWFLCGMMVGICICGMIFEKVLNEFDKEIDMYQAFIRNAKAHIEVIDDTSKK